MTQTRIDKSTEQKILRLLNTPTHRRATQQPDYTGKATAHQITKVISTLLIEAEVNVLKQCRNAAKDPTIKNDKFYFDIGYEVMNRLAQLNNSKGEQ